MGVRVLGVAESFVKGRSRRSVLAGVVMRGDLQIDGFAFGTITVGGMDATEGVIEVYRGLSRSDINFVFLNGCVISWFNVVDLDRIYEELGVPLVCVTYEESEGLEKYFREYFADWEERLKIYNRLGERETVSLGTGYELFIRYLGLTREDAVRVVNKFTLQGAIPEPLKAARLLARALVRSSIVTLD
ncbi:MAG: endonuclease dU [Candidatus Jordarchaeum sp.]|uniref:endonuclease dU n=1 Tax=Candidatus Jordarchaeum sp. TaxID=2823881 RepID=UPI00404AC81C